jgi:hypothetical protein
MLIDKGARSEPVFTKRKPAKPPKAHAPAALAVLVCN